MILYQKGEKADFMGVILGILMIALPFSQLVRRLKGGLMMSSKGLTALGGLLLLGTILLGGVGGPLVMLVGAVLTIICFACAYSAKKNE